MNKPLAYGSWFIHIYKYSLPCHAFFTIQYMHHYTSTSTKTWGAQGGVHIILRFKVHENQGRAWVGGTFFLLSSTI